MDSGYLERLESERFGASSSLSEHMARLEKERFSIYQRTRQLSGVGVEFFCKQLREEYRNGQD